MLIVGVVYLAYAFLCFFFPGDEEKNANSCRASLDEIKSKFGFSIAGAIWIVFYPAIWLTVLPLINFVASLALGFGFILIGIMYV